MSIWEEGVSSQAAAPAVRAFGARQDAVSGASGGAAGVSRGCSDVTCGGASGAAVASEASAAGGAASEACDGSKGGRGGASGAAPRETGCATGGSRDNSRGKPPPG